MREHLACIGDQLLQKGELCWRQPHLYPVARLQYLKAAYAQVPAHEVAQRHLIFGEQNALRLHRHTCLLSSFESAVATVSPGTIATTGETSPLWLDECSAEVPQTSLLDTSFGHA